MLYFLFYKHSSFLGAAAGLESFPNLQDAQRRQKQMHDFWNDGQLVTTIIHGKVAGTVT